MTHQMEACVLGPLTLVLDGRDATPSAQKQRQILALLLFRGNESVPVSTLIEELWHDEPPRSAVAIVQTYVLGLRKNLARHLGIGHPVVSKELLRTARKGYSFDTSAGYFDLCEYYKLVCAAKRRVASGDDEAAAPIFQQADELWRGPVLADVECGLPLATEVALLEQTRLADVHLRIETQLRLGRHREVRAELAGLIVRHPYDEKLHAYLMLTLCQAGWRSQALQVYQTLRKSMVDDLGLEPCAEIQRLHRDILAASTTEVPVVLDHRHADRLFG